MPDQLFEWDDLPKAKEPKVVEGPVLVPRPPGYHLISTSKGVIGFHRSKVPEAAMATHGSVMTYCGHLGRRLDEYPAEIPLCVECEAVASRK